MRKRTSKFTWAVTIALIAWVVLSVWAVVSPHIYEPSGPVTAAKASAYLGIAVPPEATNIRIFGYHQGNGYQRMVRFEAPIAACLRAAAAAVPDERLDQADEYDLKRVRTMGPDNSIAEPTWFDLSKATNAIAAGGGPGKPRVWVDQDHEVFYCIISD